MPNFDKDAFARELYANEGYRGTPYPDTHGTEAVGIGRNLGYRGRPEPWLQGRDLKKNPVSKREAYEMVGNDIDHFDSEVAKRLPFYEKLDGKRQRALLNVAFNIGVGGLLQFKGMLGNLEKAVNTDNPDKAKQFYKKAADNLEFNYHADGTVRGNTKYWNQVKTRGPRVKYQLMTGKEHPYYEEFESGWSKFRGK